MEIISIGDREKNKAKQSQFQGPNYPQRGKTEARYRISEAGRRWTTDRIDDARLAPRQSSLILSAISVLCRQARIEKNRSERPIMNRIKQIFP